MIRARGLPLMCQQSKGHRLLSSKNSLVLSSISRSNLSTAKTIEPLIEGSSKIEHEEIRASLRDALPELLPPVKSNVLSESSNAGAPVTSSFVLELAELNGFRQINLDPEGFVQLAEGVVAEPKDRKTFNQHYLMYVRPASSRAKEEELEKKTSDSGNEATLFSLERFRGTTTPQIPPKPELPPFREEDFTLYRILQSHVEDNINRREQRLRTYLRFKFNQAKESYRSLIESANRLSVLLTGRSVKLVSDMMQKDEGIVEALDQRSSQDVPLEAMGTLESEEVEDLLIYSNFDGNKRISLLQDVPSQFRLLALPTTAFRLRHGRAATLIYTALVSSAAVPLAYRSLKYAMDYPYLAQALVASVVGSVSYSLWSWRDGARTRQLLAVTTASMSRLAAKDNAALSVLQERRWLLDAAIDEYLERLNKDASENSVEEDESLSSSDPSCFDTIQVAIELGLLKRDECGKLVAVAWEDWRRLHR